MIPEYTNLITELFQSIVNYVHMVTGGNEFATGVVLASIIGVVTYAARGVPRILFDAMVKQCTVKLDLNSSNRSFHLLSKYLEKQNVVHKSRYIKIGNGMYGSSKNVKEIGYGKQIMWIKGVPVLVEVAKEKSDSDRVKEIMTLIKFGRSHNFFNELISMLEEFELEDKTSVFKQDGSVTEFLQSQPKRSFDTVAIPKSDISLLKQTLDDFINGEDWYVRNGIPYQLGILLYGPPGTGKTSLIKAIAAYLDYNIVIANSATSLSKALATSSNELIAVEEIDTLGVKSREAEEGSSTLELLTQYEESINVGSILNAIDGIATAHGRVLVGTTNHIEKLDPAILRPGRFDLKIRVDYLNVETFNMLLKRFFPDHQYISISLRPGISGADIQNDVRLGFSATDIIEEYKI